MALDKDAKLYGYQENLHAPITRCELEHLGKGVECPDPVTHVIVNVQKAGYIPICAEAAKFFYADQNIMVLMTREDFEYQRKDGLYVDRMTPVTQPMDGPHDVTESTGT